jgi:hypothetical protein
MSVALSTDEAEFITLAIMDIICKPPGKSKSLGLTDRLHRSLKLLKDNREKWRMSEKRRVQVMKYEEWDPAIRARPKGFDYVGTFHGWGVDYEEFETEPGNYTVAIVEKDNGEVVLVHASLIRFMDRGTDD